MGLLLSLRRHCLAAVLTALTIWVAQPALAAFCPCLAVVAAADAAPAREAGQSCVPDCCGHCCVPPSDAPQSQLTRPVTAYCSALDASFFHQGATLEDSLPAKQVGERAAVDFAEFSDFSSESACSEAIPSTGPPRRRSVGTLASLVAKRCHPCHAPPLA